MDSKGERVFDKSIKLADNAMLKRRPELFYEWDFEKNDELGLDVYKVTYGSGRKAWWKCRECNSEYNRDIGAVLQAKECPYCAGIKVNHTNSLASIRSDLASEWHPTLNTTVTPNSVTCGQGVKVWWTCQLSHEWKMSVLKRAGRGDGCPYCGGKRILIGFNDMWTTNPELAELLADPEDGYKFMQMSNVVTDWVCSKCQNAIKSKQISSVNSYGLSCPACSDNIPYGEKFVSILLQENSIEFEHDTSKDWSQGKRYDFYLPEYDWIIEVHGAQHFSTNGFKSMGGRTLKSEQENDIHKENLAKENDIKRYIIIDAEKSTPEHLYHSIVKSDIADIAHNIDINHISKRMANSLLFEICKFWENGMLIKDISSQTRLTRHTIRKYLKRGRDIGLCGYSEEESKVRGKKEILQLNHQGEVVKVWNSASKAARYFNVSKNAISRCANGGRKTSAGFKWMYLEDYNKAKGER